MPGRHYWRRVVTFAAAAIAASILFGIAPSLAEANIVARYRRPA
jgi:hypothetical protein